ncbi:hypothetical protein OROMI_009684 [Orobanche minor]
MLKELSRREEEENIKVDPDIDMYMKATSLEGQDVSVLTDYTLKILGLEDCADTVVGNEMIRGISGGEKKRLTAALGRQLEHISAQLEDERTIRTQCGAEWEERLANSQALMEERLAQSAAATAAMFKQMDDCFARQPPP